MLISLRVRVKLIGVSRVLSGKSQIIITLEKGASVGGVVQKLIESFPPEFRDALVDPVLGEPWSALILVNGREISVLDGVGAVVEDGDEVVFVPVVHGG